MNKFSDEITRHKEQHFIGFMLAMAFLLVATPAMMLATSVFKNDDVRKCTSNLEAIYKAKLSWRSKNPKVNENAMIHMSDLPLETRELKCPSGGMYYPGSISASPYCTKRTNTPSHKLSSAF